ncbi:MAG: DegV family EDD domain-containing protein [Oscillospiraceae bacterium]|nr:DegV family EDD domain-containing protein [Oscillospiraceae bacterium]
MSRIILVAETGADITAEQAREKGIWLVPMHVSMGDKTLDDGTFPAEEICAYYDRTGTLPKTSGSSPDDFTKVFAEIHALYPDAHILHLAYSAVTTVSYQSAVIAAQGLDYVTSLDTRHLSAGQGLVVLAMADRLAQDPDMTLEQAVACAEELSDRARMCFMPRDLEYLRAGGRVSNAVALGGKLLSLHPCIEVLGGRLLAKKKYRGRFESVVPQLIREYSDREKLDRSDVAFICSTGMSDSVRALAEQEAARCGFKNVHWVKTGCVITAHGGPGCFGIAGFAQE